MPSWQRSGSSIKDVAQGDFRVKSKNMGEERRQYRRIQAAVYCRPAGVGLLERRREAVDISLGGVRVYSDDAYRLGALMKMEFFVEGVPPVTYTAEVVWVEALERGAPAKFDVGLKFVNLAPDAIQFLKSVLGPEAPPAPE
jgi:c-di-GMP-binding flagellar brake protein YcgR